MPSYAKRATRPNARIAQLVDSLPLPRHILDAQFVPKAGIKKKMVRDFARSARLEDSPNALFQVKEMREKTVAVLDAKIVLLADILV